MKYYISQEPTIFLLNKLWQFSGDNKNKIILYIFLFFIANCMLLAGPWVFGQFIGEIEKCGINSTNIHRLIFLLFLLVIKELLFWFFHGPARIIEHLVAFRASLNYRYYLMKGLLELRLYWHGKHDTGDTIDKVNKACKGLIDFGENVFQIVQIMIKLLGTSLVLLCFSPWIGLSVFLYILFSFFVIFQFDKRLIPQYRKLNEYENKAAASLFDALTNITTVKILHVEKTVLEGVISYFKSFQSLYRTNIILNEIKWFTVTMCFQIIGILPIIFYIYFGFKKDNIPDVASISTLYLYLSDIMFLFFGFGSFYEKLTQFKHRVLNAESIEKMFKSKDIIYRKPVGHWDHLVIYNLKFRYDEQSKHNDLDDITVKIKRGERIAVIGGSGSGKTTFLKVIHGIYPNATAIIDIDHNLGISTCFADLDLNSMLVPQEPEIFSSSIYENITLGINYRYKDIMKAACLAAFDTVISRLPNKLDSVINEKGANLSGGQKQRLALTRALLFSKNKNLLLLDESTSSIDPENEHIIYQNIWSKFKGKTIIASVHKMNLLKFFDRILVFERGKIIDQGTFQEVMQRNIKFKSKQV